MHIVPGQRPRSASKRPLTLSAIFAAALSINPAVAQTAPAAPLEEEEPVILSPFTVSSTQDRGYQATNTLAGTRIRTDLADVGSSISVITKDLLDDLGASDNQSVLGYALNTEVGGPRGNFSGATVGSSNAEEYQSFMNPNANTRVRGLTNADNTRNYYLTSTSWDGYNVSRIDLQRGPNAILFGLGSPAGVVNATTDSANFRSNRGEVVLRVDQFGSMRQSLNYNYVVIPDQLAVRLAILNDEEKFRQDPAFEDDRRVYAALAFKPRMLNSRGTFFQVSANYEHAEIDSNRPRFIAPLDMFTPFFTPLSEGGAGKQTVNHRNFSNPATIGGLPNPNYNPWIETDFTRGPVYIYNGLGQSPHWQMQDFVVSGALTASGQIASSAAPAGSGFATAGDTTIYGRSFRQQWIKPYNAYATTAGVNLPFSNIGLYDAKSITDPSIFDFYNKLIDGPNKSEWSKWDNFEINLSNTFLNGKLGYDLSYYQEEVERGQLSLLSFWNRIKIDINEFNYDGSPNPNVGRIYVGEENYSGNTLRWDERQAYRAQLFGEHDFNENRDSLLGRILGKQRLTGVYMSDNNDTHTRTFHRLIPGQDFRNLVGPEGDLPLNSVTGGITGVPWRISPRYYLSGDVRSLNTPLGLQLSNVADYIIPQGGVHTIRTFDPTWNPPAGVTPGQAWAGPTSQFTTQSQNPANYKGWGYSNFTLVEALDGTQASLDYATREAVLTRFQVDSKVLVWQGQFWDNSLIFTYGWREDESESTTVSAAALPASVRRTDGGATVDPRYFNYDAAPTTYKTTQTRNWSAVAHLHRLLPNKLPLNVSLFYNAGEAFQPVADRIDAVGAPLEPPEGTTEEYGILLATKDNRYSLRVTKYETEILRANSTANITNFFQLQQAIWNPARRIAQIENGAVDISTWNPDFGGPDRLLNVLIPAWKQFALELEEKFPGFVSAWTTAGSLNPQTDNFNMSAPAAMRLIEDSISKGYEIELTANPTPNWRVALNVSKTKAIRDNVPGEALIELLKFIDNAYMNTPAGEMPAFFPNPISGTPQGVRQNPWPGFRNTYLWTQTLNGQPQPEIREWRANLITNYTFREGALRGFGVGGAYRYEDDSIIEYQPYINEAGDPALDLSKPIRTDDNHRADLWVSYSRRLTSKINWRVQLNVYNAFGRNKLVPINAQPDGTPGLMRIQEGRSWAITNTFTF